MRAITCALLDKAWLPPGPILELGCGGGQLLAELSQQFPAGALYGVDLHPLALAYACRTLPPPPRVVQSPLQQLPFVKDSFALVIALDTLDQSDVNLAGGLREIWQVLRADGMLILRISAHAWLQGIHDVAFNTGRRYGRDRLTQGLIAAGFDLVRITYANALLAAPIVCLRLLQRWHWLPLLPSLYRTGGLSDLLAGALRREAVWLQHRDLPMGISLYALARKRVN